MRPELDTLLAAATAAHRDHPDLATFAGMARDLSPGNYARRGHRAEAAMLAEDWSNFLDLAPTSGGALAPPGGEVGAARSFDRAVLFDFRNAFLAAAPLAQWRLTYEGTKIDPDFMARFGCYCMIGDGGFWNSRQMSGYVVYMPSHLHYPWHHHPAEEMYLILAGEAEFQLEGQRPHRVRAGEAVFHPGGHPHATTTHDRPMMAYVTWRNHLDTPPVWTDPGMYE